ncbi:chitinase-3-like protein 2 isoform X2 [Amblyomma americanum]
MGAPLGIVLLFLVTAVVLLRAEGVEYQDTGFEDGGVKGGGVKGGGVKGGGEKDGDAEGGGLKDGGVKGSSSKEQCHDHEGHSPYEDDKGDTSGGVAGAGEPLEMARNAKDERKFQEEDKRRTEKKKRERAPLVCFVRAQAFERSGVQRFTVRTLPADMCTHIIYSYLETDNNTGEFMFRKRGQRGDMDILQDIGKLKDDSRAKNLKVLFSYGGGAHIQSLLNRIRDGNKAKQLVERIKFWLNKLKLDGINFHLEGPGPQVCKDDEVNTIINFIKTLRLAVGSDVMITAQLPACRREDKCNLFMSEKMSRSLDYLFLITFDYRLDNLAKAKITSGVYHYSDEDGPTKIETETCVGKWIKAGVPKHKIVPGIATHGRSFTLNDPAYNGDSAGLNQKHPLGNAAEITNTEGYMNYVETCRRAGYMGWKRVWTSYAATPYITHKDQWVSYDDKQSVDVKD